MNIIWALILTVCSTDMCSTQNIQWFNEPEQCQRMKQAHEDLPVDGSWQSVRYSCVIINGVEV